MRSENLTEKLKRWGRDLGLTEIRDEERSEVMYGEMCVSAKRYKEPQYNPPAGMDVAKMLLTTAPGQLQRYTSVAELASRLVFTEPERHIVTFRGDNFCLDVDDERVFSQFIEGDNVKVGYRKVFESRYDEGLFNPGSGRLIEKKFAGYEFVSAEKD